MAKNIHSRHYLTIARKDLVNIIRLYDTTI